VARFDLSASHVRQPRSSQVPKKQAKECRLQAEKAVSPLDKEAWLRVAEEWLKLALSTDGRRP
jgi:hypothetical protein